MTETEVEEAIKRWRDRGEPRRTIGLSWGGRLLPVRVPDIPEVEGEPFALFALAGLPLPLSAPAQED